MPKVYLGSKLHPAYKLMRFLLVLLFLLAPKITLADGSETLGDPSIAIASGSGIVAAGAGLQDAQPGTIDINVPGSVKQVLLYWSGTVTSNSPSDDTIEVNGVEVTGTLIGGPAFFFNSSGKQFYDSNYRADITSLELVGSGDNSLSVEGLNNKDGDGSGADYGAGVLVIYDDGSAVSDIQLKDGLDLAFANFPEPRKTTVTQTFNNFAPAALDRTANLVIFAGSVGEPNGDLRTNTIVLNSNAGDILDVEEALKSSDDNLWDTLTLQVTIPANATELTVQILSGSSNPGNPASLNWIGAGLSVPQVPAALGDRVWEDANVNGIQDCEDSNNNGIIGDAGDTGSECGSGIPEVPVNLLAGDCATSLGQTVFTDFNGFYRFSNLDPGDYCVEFGKPLADFCDTDGFDLGEPQFTAQSEGNNPAVDSDADTGTGITNAINLSAGEVDLKVDAGIYCPAKIGDRVWQDLDEDGLQSQGEENIADVTVNLFECTDSQAIIDNNKLVRTTTTDVSTSGMNYMFGAEPNFDLQPGEYFVQFVKPDGTEFTVPNVNGDEINSDCLGPNGVTACTTLGSRGINLNRDCGLIPPPPPACDLTLDKSCRVEIPVSGNLECEAKIAASVLEYTGSGTPSEITVTGKDKKSQVVSSFDSTTGILTVDASPGDLGSKMTITIDGVAEVIHTSCSAPYVAGQPAPLDNPKGAPSGNWLVLSFVDKEGNSVSIPDEGEGMFTDSCTFTQPQQPSCDTVGKPNTLTFKYTGGACPGDNSQGGKSSCSGAVDGTAAATISVNSGDDYTVSPAVVMPGGTFTVTRSSQDFKSNTDIDLSNSGGTQQNDVHTSCSAPLAVGDEFGAITLVGINGQTGGVDVTYRYVVTNNGDPLSNVQVTDNLLGDIGTISELGTGASDSLTRTVRISGTTVNIGSAFGLLSDGSQCPASDSTIVTMVEPPPPLGGECDGKVTDLVMKNLGADAQVRVDQKKDGTVFDDFVPTGGEFSFSGTDKKGTLGTEISIFVDDSLDTKIHTSCSQPIGPGLVSGSFEVISGNSRNGGPLPPLIGTSGAKVNDATSAGASAGAMSWMMFLGLGVIGLWRLNGRAIRSN